MLMVVLGAGASYDSIPSKPPGFPLSDFEAQYRPPLAKELFEPRPLFAGEMKNFPDCQAIIPYLQNPAGASVEAELERLKGEAHSYPVRHYQLAAVRYYLHCMLWECVQNWTKTSRKE
jgi:hypothetical protein